MITNGSSAHDTDSLGLQSCGPKIKKKTLWRAGAKATDVLRCCLMALPLAPGCEGLGSAVAI
jgi:hypothetical protein